MTKMSKKTVKLVFRLLNEEKNELEYTHFCYIEKRLLDYYMRFRGFRFRNEIANDVTDWIHHDFNIELPMTTKKHLIIFRQLIVDKYKTLYPQIFRGDVKNVSGWIRVWLSEHMERELKRGRYERF